MDVWVSGTNCRSFLLDTSLKVDLFQKSGSHGDFWRHNKWQPLTQNDDFSCLHPAFYYLKLFVLATALNISHFQKQRWTAGGNRHKGQRLTFPHRRRVSGKWCGHRCVINSHENHRLAGRLPSPPPPPPHPQTITGHPGSPPCCCCLWKLQAVA